MAKHCKANGPRLIAHVAETKIKAIRVAALRDLAPDLSVFYLPSLNLRIAHVLEDII